MFCALVGPNRVVRTKVSRAVLYCTVLLLNYCSVMAYLGDGVFGTTGYFTNQVWL